jgi:hypothetical protein
MLGHHSFDLSVQSFFLRSIAKPEWTWTALGTSGVGSRLANRCQTSRHKEVVKPEADSPVFVVMARERFESWAQTFDSRGTFYCTCALVSRVGTWVSRV